MARRAFIILLALESLNLAVILHGYYYLLQNPGSGPEGIGTAISIYASVMFAVLLGGYGLNFLLVDLQKKRSLMKSSVVTVIGSLPIFVFAILERFPRLFA